MGGAANLLVNPDFQQVNDATPAGWFGRGANISVSKDEKFHGKNCCVCTNRSQDWNGMAQNVVRFVEKGHTYDLTAYMKLGSDAKGQTHWGGVTLWFQLSTMAAPTWMRMGEVHGVTSKEWVKLYGCLNMPDGGPDSIILLAEIYFEGPVAGTSFMLTETSMEDTSGKPCVGKNLFINPDFKQLHGSVPVGWHGRGANIFVSQDVKFNGKNTCVVNNLTEYWQGLAQQLVRFIQNGHVYKFSFHVRLGPDNPSEMKKTVIVSFWYKNSNMKSHDYIRVTDAFGVSPADWTKLSGFLNFPANPPEVVPEHAELYIEVPGEKISIVCAEMVLTDINNAVEESKRSMGVSGAVQEVTGTKRAPNSIAPFPLLASKVPTENSELPRQVFISYQWDIQDLVKELRSKLENRGITCWMDIGQMGGGDALFAAIDAGMREAKVVISCVTHKYSVSENCQRELTLADCLKKPIIPVIFEKSTWPPPGQMAMIFAKMLYIDMTGQTERVPENRFEQLVVMVKNKMG